MKIRGKFTQVADKIRRDERVSVIERTNLRYLTELPQKVDLVTLDLSFISILLVSNLTSTKSTLIDVFKWFIHPSRISLF